MISGPLRSSIRIFMERFGQGSLRNIECDIPVIHLCAHQNGPSVLDREDELYRSALLKFPHSPRIGDASQELRDFFREKRRALQWIFPSFQNYDRRLARTEPQFPRFLGVQHGYELVHGIHGASGEKYKLTPDPKRVLLNSIVRRGAL